MLALYVNVGYLRNTIRVRSNHVLHIDSVCNGELPMDSREVLLVLLCQLFLLPLLHILWHDDRLPHAQPPSGIHLRRSLLWVVQSILWILHPETSKLFL